MASPEVVAAGFIVFRRLQNSIQYLIMKHSYAPHWSPPKGHVDPGESEMQTAYRETEEEAGLRAGDLNVIEGFQETLRYEVKGRPKRVEYWLAELKNPETKVKISHEHETFEWLSFDKVLIRAEYPDMQQAYRNVEEFLRKL